MTDLWMLRPAVTGDRDFILDTWYRCHPPLFGWTGIPVCSCGKQLRTAGAPLDNRVYSRGQSKLIGRLYERCAAYVACYRNDEDYILGWSVTSASAVHFVWVRDDFRQQGIAKALLAPYLGKPTFYTQPPTRGWIRKHIPREWVYDPYLAFELAETRGAA